MGLGPALGVHRVVATCGWVMFAKVIYISVKLNLGTKATWKGWMKMVICENTNKNKLKNKGKLKGH